MNTPRNGCPIVIKAIATLEEALQWSVGIFAFDSNVDDLHGLLEEARDQSPDDATLRLRAFYVVELIYSDIIQRKMFSESVGSLDVTTFLRPSYDRSTTGLLQLKDDLTRLRNRLSAESVVRKMKNDRKTSSLQWAKIYESVVEVIDISEGIVNVLEGCLRRDDLRGIASVGHGLARSMLSAHYTISDTEPVLRAILDINKEHALAPWQKKTSRD